MLARQGAMVAERASVLSGDVFNMVLSGTGRLVLSA
jgi:hypothetical protein